MIDGTVIVQDLAACDDEAGIHVDSVPLYLKGEFSLSYKKS
ncbi:hypothetical protein [Paenibacillus sp. 1001270B_150601_E10]|nr:hypothetical protein [Paenibacillus sp. 1001270B_150601_E10]